jgi:ferredoxin
MRIKLDRTVCDGFGVCGLRAPGVFSLDEWGYASLADRSGEVPAARDAEVRRAVGDCPVHAITELNETLRDPGDPAAGPRSTPAGPGRRSPTPAG